MKSKLKQVVQQANKFQSMLWVFLLLALSSQVMGLEGDQEYSHKALMIKNLMKTVTWPKGAIPDDKVNVCLLGEFPYAKSMNVINGEQIDKRAVVVRQVSNLKDAQNNCQLIYISSSEKKNAKSILQLFAGKPVLLLGDMDGFARVGGSMNFMLLNHTYAITVNLISMKNSNLVLDLKSFSQVTIFPDKKDVPQD